MLIDVYMNKKEANEQCKRKMNEDAIIERGEVKG